MVRPTMFVCTLLLATASAAFSQDRDLILKDALACWHLSDSTNASSHSLTGTGSIELGVPSEGIGSTPGAKVARLKEAYFDAGKDLRVTGNALTVYLRARDPEGKWGTALFAKRGGHEMVHFNLFSVDLPDTPGADIGFELHTDTGFVMISFPLSDIDATAWHDLAGRYDGKSVELVCDGKVMAARAWAGNELTQNDESVLIGAETEHGKPVRLFSGEMEDAALWSRALSDAEVAALMHTDKLTPYPFYTERYPSPIHYRPAAGRLADTIPFFWQGDYHIFYLRAIEKVPWEHLVSKDLIQWRELPTALRSDGAEDGPDGLHMFTGSVTEHDGGFHIFYTGWNPKNKDGREKVMHATSSDLITWTKHPEQGFYGDGKHYQNSDFRDPFVFWNEEEKCFWMILCARDGKTGKPVQGVAKSKDLVQWEQSEPLQMDPPIGDGTPECPDLFKIGDTWYLIHSPSAGATDMRYASDIHGPYRIPETGAIDTTILYAAKRMFDGKRHIITGWVRDLNGERDHGGGEWGGDQSVPREVYPGPDGLLFFRPVPEAVEVFNQSFFDLTQPVDLSPALGMDVPDNYCVDALIQMDPDAELTVGFRQTEVPGSGYWLSICPARKTAALAGKVFNYTRPVRVDTAQPIRIQAFVQGSIIECFINDAYAFTCRAYDYRQGRLTCGVMGGKATVTKLEVKQSPHQDVGKVK